MKVVPNKLSSLVHGNNHMVTTTFCVFMYLVGTVIIFLHFFLIGNAGNFDGDISPLRFLEMASEWFASAIKLSPKKAELHFQLAQVLEEQHYIQDLYGIKPPVGFFVVIVTSKGKGGPTFSNIFFAFVNFIIVFKMVSILDVLKYAAVC